MIETIKKHKRIVAVVVILILTAVIELICNFPAIRGGYDDLDLTKYMTVEEEGNREKYVISYTPSEKKYVKEIKLTGAFDRIEEYLIQVEAYNSFGKEIEKKYVDRVNPEYTEFYTTIDENVKSLEIKINKSEKTQLNAVSCTNKIVFNKYRELFFIVLFSLAYLFLFEKRIYKRLEYIFAIYAMLFGILIITYSQTQFASWDEKIHFESAYSLAYGKEIQWTEGSLALQQASIIGCNTKEEFAELREYINTSGKIFSYTEKKDEVLPSYKVLAYIPQALFIRLGIILKLPLVWIYALGKIGNLLLYVITMFFAIRLARTKKLFLMFLAMMPTSIFLAASYTYDTVVFSFVTLGCVLWANAFFYQREKTDVKNIILMVFLFSVGCFSKAVYIPLILIILLLPTIKKASRKKKLILGTGILLILGLVMMTFVLPTLTSTVAKNVTFGGDSRGGDTGVVRQLISMIKHPWASVKLMLGSVIKLDNFRNLGYPEADNYFFGNLMFFNLASHGILSDKWCALWIPLLVILILCEDSEKHRYIMKVWDKIVLTVAGLGTIFLIWLALYLDFTPVGEDYISGVQARYYLPLLYFGICLIGNNRISIKCNKINLIKATCIITAIMGFVLMYQSMLQGFLV